MVQYDKSPLWTGTKWHRSPFRCHETTSTLQHVSILKYRIIVWYNCLSVLLYIDLQLTIINEVLQLSVFVVIFYCINVCVPLYTLRKKVPFSTYACHCGRTPQMYRTVPLLLQFVPQGKLFVPWGRKWYLSIIPIGTPLYPRVQWVWGATWLI